MGAVVKLINQLGLVRMTVSSAGRWRAALIAVTAGAVSALAFAPFFLTPLLLFTLPLLLWLTEAGEVEQSPGLEPDRNLIGRGAWCGWWFGFGIHTAGLYWIGNAFLVQAEAFAWLLPFAMVLLPAGLALFHAVALAVVAAVQGPPLFRVLALAAAIGVSEWLRGTIFTGFPWNVLGYALTQPIELMQFVGVVGIYGLTVLTVLVFATPLAVLARGLDPAKRETTRKAVVRIGLLTVLPLIVSWSYGAWALSQTMPANNESVRLLIVQPSINQKDKFDPQKWNRIFLDHVALTRTALAKGKSGSDTTRIVFWPEAALPFLALREQSVSDRIAAMLPNQTFLVTGLLRAEQVKGKSPKSVEVFNSAVVYDAVGKAISIYDKHHLVPFGEYLPFQEVLEAIGLEQLTRQRGGFSTGEVEGRHMSLPGLGQALMMICYEAIFPSYATSDQVRPELLINLTNDAWFGDSSGPPQHFHQSRVRAVEQGIPLLRVANNGISGAIDARGRILRDIALDGIGVIDINLPRPISPTIYSKIENSLAALMLVILFGSIIIIGCKFRTLTD
ncbi:MAG: apolipoprotein N-acyltransferase [Pseudomonadota bacterium]